MHHGTARRTFASIVISTALAAIGCGRQSDAAARPAAPERPPVEVRLGRVEAGELPRTVRTSGTLDPQNVVTAAAEVSGKIVALYCDVGDRVKSGDRLARVDDADYVLERDQRRRALSESLARLGLDALPDGDVDFERLPSVERARLEAENAKAKLDRVRTLRDRTPPLISEQDFADVRTTWEVAESGRRLAQMNARAELATARTRRAELDVADKRLRDTMHFVPTGDRPGDGTGGAPTTFLVAQRFVAVGDRVSVGAPLLRLVDPDPLRLRVQVPERRMEGVTVGRPAKLWTAAAARPFDGLVARIRPEVDLRTRTVDVEIAVPNSELRLAAGAFATAEIDVGTSSNVPMVAASSVLAFAGVQKAFVVADGKIVEKVVVLGRRAESKVEIVSGLRVGDEIVIDPPPDLVAGSPAHVVPSAPAAERK